MLFFCWLIYPQAWNGENKDRSLQGKLQSNRMHCTYLTYLFAPSKSLGALFSCLHRMVAGSRAIFMPSDVLSCSPHLLHQPRNNMRYLLQHVKCSCPSSGVRDICGTVRTCFSALSAFWKGPEVHLCLHLPLKDHQLGEQILQPTFTESQTLHQQCKTPHLNTLSKNQQGMCGYGHLDDSLRIVFLW